jgi:splicing factor 3B subunit 3
VGNFEGKPQQIVAASAQELLLLQLDPQFKLTVHRHNVFAKIRSIARFRLVGATHDLVVVVADGGRIVFLQVLNNKFNLILQETIGKAGNRRCVPGQIIATDPKGRACMLAALENKKYTYVLNRDNELKLTISSPLESSRASLFTLAMVGVDVGLVYI